ncbi:MAG: ParB/RepB/Spo0J family partition protein [Pseudobdellovibrionaceae bacterium]
MKKYEPRQKTLEEKHHLEGQPGRDHQALILPLSVIRLENNIRRNLEDLGELVESIKVHGLLQPLVIRKEQGHFTLIAGYRRYKALQTLGLKEAPVRIQNVDENTAQVLRLIENIQRQELSGPEEIIATYRLLSMFSNSQTDLARAIGKSKTYVSRCLKVIEVLGLEKVATSQLSKSLLFEVADSKEPQASLAKLPQEEKPTVAAVRQGVERKSSGALPGGRYVNQALQFRESKNANSFSLRVNFDAEKTPAGTKELIIEKLQVIIKKLRS